MTPPTLAAELGTYTTSDLERGGIVVARGAVLDPTCGDGVFLELARSSGWGDGQVVGTDIDPDVIAGPQGALVTVQDGLRDVRGGYAMVVGNPPFGRGLPGRDSEELQSLARDYEAWRANREGVAAVAPVALDAKQMAIFGRTHLVPLFIERFLRAVRPRGVLALLLPESFFASTRDISTRAWMLRHARCLSVTSIFGRDFLRTGTRARTCWSVWQRRETPLALASEAVGDPAVLLRQPRGEEDHELTAAPGSTAFLRTISLARLLEAKRWDPRYWDPLWEDPLSSCVLPIRPLGEFVDDIVYGALGRGRRPTPATGPGGWLYVGQKTLTERGVLIGRCPRIEEERPFVQERYTLRPGDLVIPRSGMGTLGKNLLTRWDGVPDGDDAEGAVVDCFNDRVSLRGISSAWVLAVLRTEQGWWQIRRVITGVAQPNVSFVQLRALKIPVPSVAVQKEAERRWRRICQGAEPFESLRQLVRSACSGM